MRAAHELQRWKKGSDPLMVKSMTGYGRAEETVNGCTITVELRSVNNRYLDLSLIHI